MIGNQSLLNKIMIGMAVLVLICPRGRISGEDSENPDIEIVIKDYKEVKGGDDFQNGFTGIYHSSFL